MSFQGIVGHARQIELLRRAIRNGSLHHALLITGIRGVGKKTMARALARGLVCQDPATGDACGQCPACRKFDRGVHPDVYEVLPDGKFMKIEQIREIKRKLLFHPVLGEHRVFLVFEAQHMNRDAANALLKSLEEPPPGNYLILTSPDDRALLPTIVSRCQRIDLSPLPDRTVEDFLAARTDVRKSEAAEMAKLCGGSLGRAMEANAAEKDPATSFSHRRNEVILQLQQLKNNGIRTNLLLAKTWSNEQSEADELFDIFRFWLRDQLVSQYRGYRVQTGGPHHTSVGSKGQEPLRPDRIYRMMDEVELASKALRQNANKRLVFEVLLLRLAEA
ncbi:MAG: DNA polymerase III subunit delta' [Deltaproteobacteria bacterium]|nr:DNA polymerase III subunit delta' [Deltaproteobacteria bacterium]